MPWVRSKPNLATFIFGLSAGVIGGLTNVMALVLIIYSLESRHSKKKKEIIQSTNLCFMFGKIIQIAIFIAHGSFTQEILEISLYNLLIVGICLMIGFNLRKKIASDSYFKFIKAFYF